MSGVEPVEGGEEAYCAGREVHHEVGDGGGDGEGCGRGRWR